MIVILVLLLQRKLLFRTVKLLLVEPYFTALYLFR